MSDQRIFDVEEIFPTEEPAVEEPTQKLRPGRGVAKFIATNSVRFVVSSAITSLVPVETKKDKGKVFIASMVISGVINQKVKPYVDTEIDDALEFVRDVYAYTKKLTAEQNNTTVPNS